MISVVIIEPKMKGCTDFAKPASPSNGALVNTMYLVLVSSVH